MACSISLSARAESISLTPYDGIEAFGILYASGYVTEYINAQEIEVKNLKCTMDLLLVGQGESESNATTCTGLVGVRILNLNGKSALNLFRVLENYGRVQDPVFAHYIEVKVLRVSHDRLKSKVTGSVEL